MTSRAGTEPAPSHVRYDDPTAIRLARAHVAQLATLEGRGAFFAVAVAIVRGFCLLPETGAAPILASYAARCNPRWNAADQRRALINAQRLAEMPWGVLLASTAEGRALWSSWTGGRGAGKGGGHG